MNARKDLRDLALSNFYIFWGSNWKTYKTLISNFFKGNRKFTIQIHGIFNNFDFSEVNLPLNEFDNCWRIKIMHSYDKGYLVC